MQQDLFTRRSARVVSFKEKISKSAKKCCFAWKLIFAKSVGLWSIKLG